MHTEIHKQGFAQQAMATGPSTSTTAKVIFLDYCKHVLLLALVPDHCNLFNEGFVFVCPSLGCCLSCCLIPLFVMLPNTVVQMSWDFHLARSMQSYFAIVVVLLMDGHLFGQLLVVYVFNSLAVYLCFKCITGALSILSSSM